jgi:hypothetical protein
MNALTSRWVETLKRCGFMLRVDTLALLTLKTGPNEIPPLRGLASHVRRRHRMVAEPKSRSIRDDAAQAPSGGRAQRGGAPVA